MPHPIYGPPSHRLESVSFVLHLPTPQNGQHTRLEAAGRSSTRRSALWTVTETWSAPEVTAGLQPTDALHHLALIAAQDTPATQDALERQLAGSWWEEPTLPF